MEHPITPPPELVQQWKRTAPHRANEHEHYHYITLYAAQWGADQELEACCEWAKQFNYDDECYEDKLRAARRPKPPTAIGPEWQPCVKLPITVHVREQRPGETHSSTREGITPLRPDDLIMRGVQGEEYPIGRELFNQTYRMGEALATPPPEPPTSQITFNDSPAEEVIRLDKEGFHYKGQFIADAGEAHRLMFVFLKQNTKDEDDDRWPHL